ncbi:hypothetical protein G7047_11660 [Diaphorobacter sp. HDW4A]|uniref:hypothetical protein n=1 Tax=Diaphorobacter sp. HDW4A TaxID=2714924 RepID=UPI0014075507|nr:hypothetical protein [Diaphorobacter sp. HDW4A]QIL80485.1 hypothetical protein G7047_11660 [Diaphorobacter sp. HDW4A]
MKLRTSRIRLATSFLALQFACIGGAALSAEPKVTEEQQRVQAQRDVERAEIQKQRSAVEHRLKKEEADCYSQFVVESCLRSARAKARTEDGALRSRELGLNEIERRERADERRNYIRESEEQQREKGEAGRAKSDAALPGAQTESREQGRQQRELEAQQRARQQKSREAANVQEQSKRDATQPGKVERARMQYEAKQLKAAERRAKHERDLDDAAKLGKPSPAPLPAPAASGN